MVVDTVIFDVMVDVVWDVVDIMLELSCMCGIILSNVGAHEGGPDRQPTQLQETRTKNLREVKQEY